MRQDKRQDLGASLRDRATAAEPVVSALRDGVPSATTERMAIQAELEQSAEGRQAAIRAAISTTNVVWDQYEQGLWDRLNAAKSQEAAVLARLAKWSEHTGGGCPVDPGVCVHFRTRMEWRYMLAGDLPSISEDANRTASSLRWEWDESHRGGEDDIVAYRVLPAQAIEARQGQDPKGLGRNDESAVPNGDAPEGGRP